MLQSRNLHHCKILQELKEAPAFWWCVDEDFIKFANAPLNKLKLSQVPAASH